MRSGKTLCFASNTGKTSDINWTFELRHYIQCGYPSDCISFHFTSFVCYFCIQIAIIICLSIIICLYFLLILFFFTLLSENVITVVWTGFSDCCESSFAIFSEKALFNVKINTYWASAFSLEPLEIRIIWQLIFFFVGLLNTEKPTTSQH